MKFAAVTAVMLGLAVVADPAAAQAQAQTQTKAKQSAKAPKPAPQQAAPAPQQHSLYAAAYRGEPQAQYHLGLAHRDGHGAKRDLHEALAWFTLAAVNGVPEAAVELARAYEEGTGVKRDLEEAARWWYRAGDLGLEPARKRFVEMFLAGQAKSIGGPTGARWVEEVAEGDGNAQLLLGRAYEKGLGLAPDLWRAERWYRLAAFMSGEAEPRFRLGRMLLAEPGFVEKDERGVVKEVARPGMVEGERWLTAAARQGHPGAQYALGRAYYVGIELPMDLTLATSWLQAAAAQGLPEALVALADMAAKGQGFFGKDPMRAFVYYDIAAGIGYKPAEAGREEAAKALNQKQLGRARQLVQEVREARGL